LSAEQYNQTIIAAIITLIVTLIGTVVSYVFTKRKEIDAIIRQNKIVRYDELVRSLTIVVKEKLDTDPVKDFVTAYNRASTYANDEVIEACNDLLEALGRKEQSDEILTNLVNHIYLAISRDINPKARKINFKTYFIQPIKS
jgi:hypothetical protein